MKNLTFKAAMLKGSQPTVNRQSTDGQSQRPNHETLEGLNDARLPLHIRHRQCVGGGV